ncbi:MAG: hypothetical protein IJ545_06890 [Alphaproteobacteria bacterium]|nr:hypothetical protein [Alphaproteobacteria bacterium]
MLARQEIREKVIEILRNNAAVTALVSADNIHNMKITPFEGKFLPGINILTQKQDAELKSLNVARFEATLTLNVEIYVSEMRGYASTADEIAEAVEEALLANPEFTNLSTNTIGYSVEYSTYDQGARPILLEILSFNLTYYQEYKPKITDTLDNIHISVDGIEPIADPAPGPDGRIEFETDINFNEEGA